MNTSELKCLPYDEMKNVTGGPQTTSTSTAFCDVTLVIRASAKQNTIIKKYRDVTRHLTHQNISYGSHSLRFKTELIAP